MDRVRLPLSLLVLFLLISGGLRSALAYPVEESARDALSFNAPAPDIYGKIAGRVVDAASGEPLPGVNVIIDGTAQGAATDLDGQYQIIRLRPGVYTVKATFIGFATSVVEGVEVIVDKTTRVDYQLLEEVFEGQEVVVTAERGVIQVDRTTTSASVSSEQLEALPVTSIGDAVNLQAGVVDGRFRGGRSGEVAYLVNGVPINNAFNNQAAFEVEQNMVSSLEVISGVFSAEYGQAQSGVVNIVTKDVPEKWSGSFLSYIGTIASSRELEFVNRTTDPGQFLGIDDFVADTLSFSKAADRINQSDLQLSVGGPLIKDKLGFQMSARYRLDRGHILGRDLFAPSDSSRNLNSGLPSTAWEIESTGSGDFVSMSGSERLSINSTLNYKLTPTVDLEYNMFLQDGSFPGSSHFGKYVPTGLNKGYFGTQTHIASLRYIIGSKSFGNFSYSLLRDKFDQYLYKDPFDRRHQSSALSSLSGQNAFAVAGNDLFQNDQLTVTHTMLADFSSQLNNVHLMKGGVLARLHRLENRSFGIERSTRTGNQPQPSPDPFAGDTLNADPVEFSAYIQDKMEFTGLIVNAGLRFDYFNADYATPVEWQQADAETVVQNGSEVSNRESAKAKMQISPRIGIAFPISSTGVMRFSAGLFFQTPPLSLLYTNPEFEVNPAASANAFGNANLEPERTLSFEVGLQQGLTDDMGLELTIFSKDVRNLTGQEFERLPTGDYAIRWVNRDYGTIRGLTFSVFKQPGSALSWTLDYTLQFAEGTSSDPGEAFGREQSGLSPILSLVRLNWDRRHVLNNTVSITPIEGLQVTMINRLLSGEPYTTTRDFVRSSIPNNADRPIQFFSDLRAYYTPPFIKQNVQFFVQVQNLFDNEVQYAVYGTTGNANEALEKELIRRTGATVGGVNSLDEWFFQQGWYAPPRKISLGISAKF